MMESRRSASTGNLKDQVWAPEPSSPPIDRSNSKELHSKRPFDRGMSRSGSESKKAPTKKSRVAHAQKDPEYANSRSNVQKVLIFCAVLSLLVILLLWDMRQVQQMSEIIHDDKTGLWLRLNNSQVREWFSPLDICMMKLDDYDMDVGFYRNSNCSSLASVSESVPSQLYCNLGSSIGNKPCYPPLTSRTYFRSALKDQELGNPRSTRLRDALRSLAMLGKPVVFVGDGLSKQNQDAMICEIMRTDSVSIVGHYSDTAANYTIQWKNSHLRLNVLYFQLTRVREPTILTKKAKFRILEKDNLDQRRRRRHRFLFDGTATETAAAKAAQAATATQARLQAAVFAGGGTAAAAKQVPKMNPKQYPKQLPKQGAKQAPKQQPIAKSAPASSQQIPSSSSASNANSPVESVQMASKSQPLQLLPKYPTKKAPVANNSSNLSPVTGSKTQSASQNLMNSTTTTKLAPPVGARNRSSSHGVLTFDKIKKYVNRMIDENDGNGVVLIANVGVYYNSREMFRMDIPLLLEWMDELSRESNCTVFYRETAAQHYNHTSSGYYDMEYDERPFNNGSCVPIADSTPEFDWRNTDVRHVIDNDGYDRINMIPFKDITQPLHNMHPSGRNGEADCTHYCFFPQMWQIVWFNLYNELNL